MSNVIQAQPISEAEADARIVALSDELEILSNTMDADARFRMRKIDSRIEQLQHGVNVARYEIGAEMSKANQMIMKSKKNIVLPSDIEAN